MKKIAILFLIFLIVGSHACKTDCDCPQWYEGDKCKTETRGKFLGQYKGDDNCLGTTNISLNITEAEGDFKGDASKVILDGIVVFDLQLGGLTAESGLYELNSPIQFFDPAGNLYLATNIVAQLSYDKEEDKALMYYCYYGYDGLGQFQQICCTEFVKQPE